MSRAALALCLLVPSIALGTPEGDIRATFDRYRKAVASKDGAAAALEVDDNTVAYYGHIRNDALIALDVHGLPMVDKIFVLRTRSELSADALSALDGRGLLAHALSAGWITSVQLGRAVLGDIRVTGDRADAQLIVGKVIAPDRFVFHRDKGRWRVDLTAFNEVSSRALDKLAEGSRLTEDQFAMKMLTQILGHSASEVVWRPLLSPRPR